MASSACPRDLVDRLPEAVDEVRQREKKTMDFVKGSDFSLAAFEENQRILGLLGT